MKSACALVLAALFLPTFAPAAHAQAPTQAPTQPQAAPQAATSPQAPPQIRTYYVVTLTLGPNFDPKLPLMSQPNIRQHAAYMGRLTGEGKLLLGGPFVDKPGSMTMTAAMLILGAENLEEARKIEESDPAVATGLMTIAEIKPLLGFAGTWLRPAAAQPPGGPGR